MIAIEIKTDQFTIRSGIGKKTGQNYSIREQEAWAWLCGDEGFLQPFPTRFVIALDDNQPVFPIGHYTLNPSSIFVAQFSRLSLGRLKLIPSAAKTIKAA